MHLHFIRHGESIANLLQEFSNSDEKHPLTDRGLAQAWALARQLVDLPVGGLWSSPVLRAVETARVLSSAFQVPLQVTEALREWSVGIYEGTRDPAGWDLHRQVQEDWFVHRKYESRMPGGESFEQIRSRFVPFIEGVVRDSASAGKDLVLVGHGGLFVAMLPLVLSNLSHAFATRHGIPHTSIITAEVRPEGLACLSWCGLPPEGG